MSLSASFRTRIETEAPMSAAPPTPTATHPTVGDRKKSPELESWAAPPFAGASDGEAGNGDGLEDADTGEKTTSMRFSSRSTSDTSCENATPGAVTTIFCAPGSKGTGRVKR